LRQALHDRKVTMIERVGPGGEYFEQPNQISLVDYGRGQNRPNFKMTTGFDIGPEI
jgi:hypothetical protein